MECEISFAEWVCGWKGGVKMCVGREGREWRAYLVECVGGVYRVERKCVSGWRTGWEYMDGCGGTEVWMRWNGSDCSARK